MANKGRERRPDAPNSMMLRRTLFLLSVCGVAAFAVLAARLYQLQIVRHEELASRAAAQQVRETTVSAPRGTIYDRRGNVLAMSAGVDTVYLSPAEIELYGEDAGAIARGLADILGLDYGSVYEKTQNTGSWYEVVARRIEADKAAEVRAFKEEGGYNGVKIEADTKRYYPNGSLAAHVIGFVGTDNTGLGGIEAKYDKYLSGSDGFIMRSTTAAGTDMLLGSWEDYFDAVPGCDVELTIDATIQYYIEKHLAQAVEDYDIQSGAAAICMEVDTGAILAMASLGNFDLNDYQTISPGAMERVDAEAATEAERAQLIAAEQQLMWRNKALSDTYEPGSTFKIITLAMALEEGLVDESSQFFCGGSVSVPGRGTPVKCWKAGGHGPQDLTAAVQHSCNVAFVNIGRLIGEERFYDYAEAFGFFERTGDTSAQLTGRTGIDLGGESGSIWWSEDVFCDPENLSQLAAASFGQTFNITPLQLITAVSACVNGGNLMRPYLVSEITSPAGLSEAHEPERVRQVLSEETSAEICAILEQVVGDAKEGTGRNAAVAGYRIGGKTGTSTKTTQEIAGTKEYIVSFIGAAPADDPEIALLVLLDNPGSGSGVYVSGGQMAAPVVGKMLADILPYLGYEPEYSESELESVDRAVPDVTGMGLDEARAALAGSGFECSAAGPGGTVTGQLPAAGSVIASGSEVLLYAGTEITGGGTVPDLTGLTYAEARDALAELGLFVSSDRTAGADDARRVSGQDFPAGGTAAPGAVITVTLYDNDSELLGIY